MQLFIIYLFDYFYYYLVTSNCLLSTMSRKWFGLHTADKPGCLELQVTSHGGGAPLIARDMNEYIKPPKTYLCSVETRKQRGSLTYLSAAYVLIKNPPRSHPYRHCLLTGHRKSTRKQNTLKMHKKKNIQNDFRYTKEENCYVLVSECLVKVHGGE